MQSTLSNGAIVSRLLRLAWQYRGRCLLALFFQTLLIVLAVKNLGMVGLAIDYLRHVLDPSNLEPHWPFGFHPPPHWSPMQVILMVGATILTIALMRGLLQFAHTTNLSGLTNGQIIPALRAQVYAKLQRLSFRFFDLNTSGSIINRVTGDVQRMRSFIDEVLINGVTLAISLSVYFFTMLMIHPGLALACLLTSPVIVWVSIRFSQKIRPDYEVGSKNVDDLILGFSESVQGMEMIKGFARETDCRDRFEALNQKVCDHNHTVFRKVSRYSAFMEFMTNLNLAILLGYGGWLVYRGELSLGAGLVVFAGLLQQFSGQISNVANLLNIIQQSLIGSRRVFEVLDAPIEILSAPNARPIHSTRGEIQFENVRLDHSQPVLRDVSFHVKPGQLIAIMGATGAGKSALLSLIPRFYDPSQGRILLDGHDLRDLSLEDLRRHIGLVFQESFLFRATVAQNIAFGSPEATQKEIERAARIASAHEFIQALPRGYETMLQEGGSNLSGGQRQRLAIARALLVNPRILILDDPTASLDPETDAEIFQAMNEMMKGRTTFIVAHRVSSVRKADQILVLDNGKIIQRGTHEELMSQGGLYWRVARHQLIDSESLLREGVQS